MIINRYNQQSNRVTWVMGGLLAGMVPISTSPITINSFFHISRGIVAGLFRPRSTSDIINTYITPLISIIMNYISPPVTIITTYTTPLRAMTTIPYSLVTMEKKWDKKKLINSTIYPVHMGCGRKIFWSETYIHISRQHQLLFQDLDGKIGWYLET